jgi:hypothetical protein
LAFSIKSFVDKAIEYNQAMAGLEVVAGNAFKQVKKDVMDLSKDGQASIAQMGAAFKNLLSRGYTEQQAKVMLENTKALAMFNRQYGTVGESVQRFTEGLRNEMSTLTDTAGAQKNLDKVWKEFAKTIGTTSDKLTQAQKVQAEYNYFSAEGAKFLDKYKEMLDSDDAALGRFGNTIKDFQRNVGQILLPVLADFVRILDSIFTAFNNLPKPVQTMIVMSATMAATIGTLSAATGAFKSLLGTLPAIFNTVKLGAMSLNAALGIIGLIIVGVTTIMSYVDALKQKEIDLIGFEDKGNDYVIFNAKKSRETLSKLESALKEREKLRKQYLEQGYSAEMSLAAANGDVGTKYNLANIDQLNNIVKLRERIVEFEKKSSVRGKGKGKTDTGGTDNSQSKEAIAFEKQVTLDLLTQKGDREKILENEKQEKLKFLKDNYKNTEKYAKLSAEIEEYYATETAKVKAEKAREALSVLSTTTEGMQTISDLYYQGQINAEGVTAEEKKRLQKDQWKINKALSISNATISMFQAIVKATEAGWPMGVILAGLTAAFDAAQIAVIASQPMPAFAKGGIVPGTSFNGDQVLARVNSGEGVFTKEQMAAMAPVNNNSKTTVVKINNLLASDPVDFYTKLNKKTSRKEAGRR